MCDELAHEIFHGAYSIVSQQKAKKAAQYRNRKSNAALDDKSDDESGDPNVSLGLPMRVYMNLFKLI